MLRFRFNGNRKDCSFPILEHYMHARTFQLKFNNNVFISKIYNK